MGRMIVELVGQRFGRLTVTRPTDQRKNGYIVWECKCDCGNTTFVVVNNLKSGKTRSCGCLKKVDLTGQRFGMLVAIHPTEERRSGQVIWECECNCGATTFVKATDLRNGKTRSCGCLQKKNASENKRKDISGQRFGMLTAVRPTDQRKDRSIVWECKCDCGNNAFVSGRYLKNGSTKSCGCLRRKR